MRTRETKYWRVRGYAETVYVKASTASRALEKVRRGALAEEDESTLKEISKDTFERAKRIAKLRANWSPSIFAIEWDPSVDRSVLRALRGSRLAGLQFRATGPWLETSIAESIKGGN